MYNGTVNYGGTAIINVYAIVSDIVIHGGFYYIIVSEFRTHDTDYKLRTWNAQGKAV